MKERAKTKQLREKVRSLRKDGMSFGRIGKTVGISKAYAVKLSKAAASAGATLSLLLFLFLLSLPAQFQPHADQHHRDGFDPTVSESPSPGKGVAWQDDGKIPEAALSLPGLFSWRVPNPTVTDRVEPVFPLPYERPGEIKQVTCRCEPEASWYDAAWGFRKAITIDNTKVSGTGSLSNFPVLIDITSDNDLRDTGNGGNVGQADGGDILFTTSDSLTKLDHEEPVYIPSTGRLLTWVKVNSVAGTADTEILMYYGNAGAADQWNTAGTWSGFNAVWHLEETPSATAVDSTGNGHTMTPNNMEAGDQVAGQIGGALDFDGVDEFLEVQNDHIGAPSDSTLSAWVNLDGPDTNGAEVISIGDVNALRADETVASNVLGFYHHASGWHDTETDDAVAAAGWKHLVYTRQDNLQKVYIDGVEQGSSTFSEAIVYTGGGAHTRIGKHGNTSTAFDFDGRIDEVRVAPAFRPVDWVLTEFNNQSSPATFYAVGSQETEGGTCSVSVNFDARDFTTPDTPGTDLSTTEFSIDEMHSTFTSFDGDATNSQGEGWNMSISAVSGNPKYVRCDVTVEKQ